MGERNVEKNAKLYWVIAIFGILCCILISIAYVGDKIQTGIHGYLSGEAEWSKAQKKAVISLMEYLNSKDETYYEGFKQHLAVIEGDSIARHELMREIPDLEKARRGLLYGKNHPDEIDAMIWVFRNFSGMETISDAVQHWEQGDTAIFELFKLAEGARERIQSGDMDEEEMQLVYAELLRLDDILSHHESNFSTAMSQASRTTGKYIFWSQILVSVFFTVLAGVFAVSFMRNIRNTNLRLLKSEDHFRRVLDQSRDVIYQIKIGADKYDFMSSSVYDMLGISAEKIMEGGPQMILDRTHPEDIDRMKRKVKQLESDNVEQILILDTEFRVRHANGNYVWVSNKRSLLKNEEGEPEAIIGNVRDISVRKHQMEKLDKSLVEKQTLLAEIHHRVKNNLAIVSSLIELQKDGANADQNMAFRDVQSRIKSIALIHEKLYENTIFSEVELNSYLRELAEIISDTYRSDQKNISFSFKLDDVKVDMTLAVPVGLVCNELINNCFKHAFNGKKEGEIQISLKRYGDHAEVEVEDNGCGLPENFSMDQAGGLGITLLNVLTQQVRGEMIVQNGERTRFTLRFPTITEQEKDKEKAEPQPVSG